MKKNPYFLDHTRVVTTVTIGRPGSESDMDGMTEDELALGFADKIVGLLRYVPNDRDDDDGRREGQWYRRWPRGDSYGTGLECDEWLSDDVTTALRMARSHIREVAMAVLGRPAFTAETVRNVVEMASWDSRITCWKSQITSDNRRMFKEGIDRRDAAKATTNGGGTRH